MEDLGKPTQQYSVMLWLELEQEKLGFALANKGRNAGHGGTHL